MKENWIALYFKHPTWDLSYLETALGLPMRHGWTAGKPWVTNSGAILPARSDNYWNSGFEFSQERGFIEDINIVLELFQKENVRLRELIASGGSVAIYLQFQGNVNDGDNIPAAMLKRIGDLGVELSLEIFPSYTLTRKLFNKVTWKWTRFRHSFLPKLRLKQK